MGLESILGSHALGYVHFDLKLGIMLWRRKINNGTYEAVLSDVKGAKRA
jgi:hypothetical protein